MIERYPEDKPYPSYLVLGFPMRKPVHIVAADNHQDQETIVITVHEPDLKFWQKDFKKRLK